MKRLNHNIISLLILALLLSLSGCKSKKTVLYSSEKLEKKSMADLFESIKRNEIKYNTIECKGKIELRKGTSGQKTSAVFKLIKDSLMQISIRPIFGTEAMRITFSPSNVLIIDRLGKQYSLIEYNELKSFSLSAPQLFYNMQALFTNKLFIPGKADINHADLKNFNLSATDDVYLLQTQAQNKNLFINFAVDATDRIASTLLFDKDRTITFQWSYLDFVVDKNDKSVYPTLMDAKLQAGKHRLDISIECPQLDIDNKNFKIDNSIPSKYDKVDFGDIVNKYMGLIK